MDEHLGYGKSERYESDDYRNGYKPKMVNSSYGQVGIEVHQDRKSTFEPQIEGWRNRPLDEGYPILYIDTIHYSVRDNGVIRKLATYVILGINTEGKKALVALEQVTEKWTPKYPNAMKRWKDNRDVISSIFKFSSVVRKVIYTTNAIESLNSTYRKLNCQRSVFPNDTALLKALYLATFEATKKWTATIRNRAQVYGELSIMYEGRLPE